MTPRDFPHYAELWQEQIEPEELAELQATAKNIERTASRKWLLDFFLAFLAVGLTCGALWKYPTSSPVKLGFAVLAAVIIWAGWRRHQITGASRATAIDDPRLFFEKTIRNVRAEINLSTISLCLGPPTFFSAILLGAADHGLDIDVILHQTLEVNLTKTMVIMAMLVLAGAYFLRDNIRLRGQLRRLEGMSREWDEQQAGDLEGQ